MPANKPSTPFENNNISIGGDVVDSVVVVGNNNVVSKPTIIQKFFNIFKSDADALEQRNRRILLNHVENAWIKGLLDASLYGAAMLDLGIKETPEAITNKYPWMLKKESTDETIPPGTSMLEIFDSIGMGRSLLILGAPGSGKTTMLLELTRQLIARAKENVTQPIPMVFNLASWTEKLTLADWLAQELNNLYSVPRKTAPDWVKGNKLLLLLDGLDEVRQESRVKCVEAINEFRKQNGLTSLAVCSCSQDYSDLNAKLAFEGAIEVQPLTQGQIDVFFDRFGDEMAGIKQILQKDSALREIAETPMFLSVMTLAYKNRSSGELSRSKNTEDQRKNLFNVYINRMFERPPRNTNFIFSKRQTLDQLCWLAQRMKQNNIITYQIEAMQFSWLKDYEQQNLFRWISKLIFGLIWFGLGIGLCAGLGARPIIGWFIGGVAGLSALNGTEPSFGILFRDKLRWSWSNYKEILLNTAVGAFSGAIAGVIMVSAISAWFNSAWNDVIYSMINGAKIGAASTGVLFALNSGICWQIEETNYAGQHLRQSLYNGIYFTLFGWVVFGLIFGMILGLVEGLSAGLFAGLSIGLMFGLDALVLHYLLRFTLKKYKLLPWRLIPFLDHCVDLIFLRRVGGGYIFVHRLLMEHFAEMYKE